MAARTDSIALSMAGFDAAREGVGTAAAVAQAAANRRRVSEEFKFDLVKLDSYQTE
jgi:hypothetical protein